MDKRALIRSVLAQLEAELARQAGAALDSRAEATDEESRAEGKYDMRSQSAAYLAEGQTRLAADIAAAIAAWSTLDARAFGAGEPIATGALVTLEGPGGPSVFLLGPHSGGMEARAGGGAATVVTAGSPLGRQLVGRRAGDRVRAGSVEQRVAAVE